METAPPNAAKPKSRRRWFQFGLRTLLIGVMLIGCGLGWLGMKVQEGRQQGVAVEAIRKLGGSVYYDYQFDSDRFYDPKAAIPGPTCLRAVLGDDAFRKVDTIHLSYTQATDDDLQQFKTFTQLKELTLDATAVTDNGVATLKGLAHLGHLELNNTQLTDAGLEHLKSLSKLRWLDIGGTQVTHAGVAQFRKALPQCHIEGRNGY